MKEPFLTVYGHVTMDQIVGVSRFPDLNETVDISSKRTVLGGTGSNIAVTAARLGVPTALAALVGRDLPAAFSEAFEESGLITDDIVAVDGYDTSTCIILDTDAMEQKAVFFQGPQGYGSSLGIDLTGCARRSKNVHFCTGDPDWYLEIMGSLEGPAVAADPSQETYRFWNADRLDAALGRADRLFCNEFEAKVICERTGVGSVLDLPLDLVVETLGEKGSVARWEGETFEIPCIPGAAVRDPTGCGDSYRAGFYAGLYRGFGVRDSLVLGATVSSFVIEEVGALTNTPTWDAVLERADPHLEG